MACSFDDKDKATRRTKLTKLLPSFGVDMQIEFPIQQTLPQETYSTRPDLHLSVGGTTVLLGEAKAEFETGDPNMQISQPEGPRASIGWCPMHTVGSFQCLNKSGRITECVISRPTSHGFSDATYITISDDLEIESDALTSLRAICNLSERYEDIDRIGIQNEDPLKGILIRLRTETPKQP